MLVYLLTCTGTVIGIGSTTPSFGVTPFGTTSGLFNSAGSKPGTTQLGGAFVQPATGTVEQMAH